MKDSRCAACSFEFDLTDPEIQGKRSCPKCNSVAAPLCNKEDITVNINWNQLVFLLDSTFGNDPLLSKDLEIINTNMRKYKPDCPQALSLLVDTLPNKISDIIQNLVLTNTDPNSQNN